MSVADQLKVGDEFTIAGLYAPEPWWRPIRRRLGLATPPRTLQTYTVQAVSGDNLRATDPEGLWYEGGVW